MVHNLSDVSTSVNNESPGGNFDQTFKSSAYGLLFSKEAQHLIYYLSYDPQR